jgi:hypothetical protein
VAVLTQTVLEAIPPGIAHDVAIVGVMPAI